MSPWLRLASPAKFELWVSIPLGLVSFIHFNFHRPIRPIDTIGEAAGMTLAWVFALNALLDFRRMSLPDKLLTCIWFPVLTVYLCYVLYDAFTTRSWADR